jgi:hypothetical protein
MSAIQLVGASEEHLPRTVLWNTAAADKGTPDDLSIKHFAVIKGAIDLVAGE